MYDYAAAFKYGFKIKNYQNKNNMYYKLIFNFIKNELNLSSSLLKKIKNFKTSFKETNPWRVCIDRERNVLVFQQFFVFY